MPEVAEVRLIADSLDSFLTGNHLTQFRIRNPIVLEKWINRNCSGLPSLNKQLDERDLLVKGIYTQGKFCWIACENEIYIGISFGMSGNIRPEPTPEFLSSYKWKNKMVGKEEYLKHCHIAIEYYKETKDDKKVIYYHDIRRFGRFDIYYSRTDLEKKLSKLGQDPLSQEELRNDEIIRKFRLYNYQNICKTLMDQELFAGVGNFIKSETLYASKIDVHAIIKDIPDNSLIELYNAIRKIAKDDYDSGGCSLYTFSGMHGDVSDFKQTLKVYGHEGELDPNGYIIRRIPAALGPDKRSTFWVPEIQIVGRPALTTKSLPNIHLDIKKLPKILHPIKRS